MKKLLFILLAISTNYTQAQAMVVNDPAANQTLLTSISQGAQQVQQGLEQLEYLNKAKEAITKVSSVVRDLNEIKEIYTLQKEILKNSTTHLRQLQSTRLFKPKEMREIAQSFTNLIDNSIKSIDTLKKLLQDDLLKMSDAERLNFIRDLKEEIQVKHSDTEVLYQKYLSIGESRALNQLFKSQN